MYMCIYNVHVCNVCTCTGLYVQYVHSLMDYEYIYGRYAVNTYDTSEYLELSLGCIDVDYELVSLFLQIRSL